MQNMGYIIFFFSPSLFHDNFGLCIGIIIIIIVAYPGFAQLIRRVLGFIIEFIGTLYDWSLSDALPSSSDWTLHWNYFDFQLNSTPLLRCTLSYSDVFLQFSCNSSGTGPTENSVFCCHECVFIGPLPSNGYPSIVETITSGMCLPSRCLAMDMCVILLLLLLLLFIYLFFVINCLDFFCLCVFVFFILMLTLQMAAP
jgi:hypothetical protein